MIPRLLLVMACAALLAMTFAGHAPGGPRRAETVPGPVTASVLRIVDGDTLVIRATIWLGQTVETTVRVAGLDAPEARGRCAREKRLARRATRRLRGLLDGGSATLRDVRHGKYAGRVVARVATPQGRDVADILIGEGLARPYRGRRRRDWCD